MELTPEQESAIARLYENESLTENLTDPDAQALLEWAQGQIAANTDDTLVRAAVSAANSSGEQGVQALVTQASTFLAQELAVRADAAARANESASAMTMADSNMPETHATAADSALPPTAAAADEITGRPVTDTDARMQASASAAQITTLSATADANLGPATPIPTTDTNIDQATTSPATGTDVGPATPLVTPPPARKRKKSRKSKRSKKK